MSGTKDALKILSAVRDRIDCSIDELASLSRRKIPGISKNDERRRYYGIGREMMGLFNALNIVSIAIMSLKNGTIGSGRGK